MLLALVLVSAPEAQERREVTIGAGEAPLTVLADRIENLERERLLIAEGRVEIEQGDVRLEADRVEVNTETGEAVAAGRVVLFDGRDRLTGTRIEFNFRTGTGIVHQAEGTAEPHFFFGGERMERFGDKAYRMFRGVFTTCEAETPAWSVRWGSATAYLDDYMWGTNASFWVWKVPVVPFIPIFGASLRRDRHSGFLTPTFSTSSDKGFGIQLPYYWVIADNQDLVLTPTYYAKRGFGLGAQYRYVRAEGSRGEFDGFYLNDTQVKENRWVVGLRHEELITPRLTLKADLARVSDNDFFEEYGNTLDERSKQRLESNLSLTQRWDTWNLFGRLFFYQDLTTEAKDALNRLPEIRLSAFQQPVPWVPGLLFEMESSYNNFVRDVGPGGQRLDLFPNLSYPFSPGGLFTLTPRVGFRETLYNQKAVGTTVDQGITVEETETEFQHRSLLSVGMDLEARAYRVFEVGGALGIERLQHVIEPRVGWSLVTGDDNAGIPQYDGVDAVPGKSNLITYSLINRLKARAVGEGNQPGRVWELARLTLQQSYDIQGDIRDDSTIPGTGGRLSSIFADLILEPLYGIRARGTTAIDPYDGRILRGTIDLEYQAERWRVAGGTRYGQGGRLQFFQGLAEVSIGSRWRFHVSTQLDTDPVEIIENRFEVTFLEQCWAISAAFINRVDENEFRIAVNLLELGQYGFGRAFGATQTQ
jgi:LPS-assembly protein